MDLSSLKHSLEARDARVSFADDDFVFTGKGPSVADELIARHSKSTQPESQQLCVIVASVLEVIQTEGLQPTPTALFAAGMSSLQRPETVANPEVTAAMCTLLSASMARVPTSVLRSRAVQGTQVLVNILELNGAGQGAVPRAALPCLCQLLAAMGAADWPAMSRGFNLVLAGCLDRQPKLRKKAQSGIVDIMAALQSQQAALGPASEAVLKLAQRVLSGPLAAAKAAAAAPGKKRQQAEAAIAAAVADALHLLGVIRQVIALLSVSATKGVCEQLINLLPLRQALLTRNVTDTLAALCSSTASHLPPQDLSDLLTAVLTSEAFWDKKDADAALGLISLIEVGELRLAAAAPQLAVSVLPRAVHVLVPLLASHHGGVRRAATLALNNVVAAAVSEPDIIAAVESVRGQSRQKLPAVQRVVVAVESALGPQYRDAWEGSLSVAGGLMERLGRRGGPLAEGLVRRIGQLCAGADDLAAEDEEAAEEEAALAVAAQAALGVALRTLGPEIVLSVLPLNLEEGLAGTAEARTWLLPLLRTHVREARMGYWLHSLLPLARVMGSRAAAAGRGGPAREREAQVCGTLEAQIWATLPSFCSWAEDAGDMLPSLLTALAPAFGKRADLRTPMCNAVRRIAAQTRAVLQADGTAVGHQDPTLTFLNEDEPGSNAHPDDAEHYEIPADFPPETSKAALGALRENARSWLPQLLNAFVAAVPNQRSHFAGAVAAYACVCDAATVSTMFRAAVTKLMKATEQARTGELGVGAVLEGGNSDSERRCTFLEAALLLAGGLDVNGSQVLWKAAVPGTTEKDPAVQKKSYKVLAYLCECRPDLMGPRFEDALCVLLEGAATSLSAAKRYRLRCLKAVILELISPDGPDVDLDALPGIVASSGYSATRAARARQVLTPLIAEIILCVKEANKRTRAAAYDLLVDVARALHESEPPTIDEEGEGEIGGLRMLVNLVLGGLVGSTPHMISASVMALARLLFEFAPVLSGLVPQLLPSVLMLLRSKAREVIKAVLGFVKVVVMRMPADELLTFLPAICEGILLWAEDSKNKFRLKVRVILERTARRCGFEALEAAVPESHRALLTHIRKQNNRKERKRSEGATEMDWDEAAVDDDEVDARSQKSKAKTGRTAARSAWNSEVFSEDGGEEEGGAGTAKRRAESEAAAKLERRGLGGRSARSVRSVPGKGDGRRLPASADPLDLLDAGTTRKMVRGGGGGGGRRKRGGEGEGDEEGFAHGKDGRMVIREEVVRGGKRKRGDAEEAGFDSGDSDFEDLKGITGLSLALRGAKSVAQAPTIAASLGGKSLAGRSQGGRTEGGRSRGEGKGQPRGRGGQHTGDRFKASKKSGAGGDVKGTSKVEPYAYWPLDRKLLNRRVQKTREAKGGLDRVVSAAKAGAAKGMKAKRARR